MDEEKKKKIVTALSDERKAKLKELASQWNLELKDLFNNFCEKMEHPAVANLEEEERMRWAFDAVYSDIRNELSRPTEWIEIFVFGLDHAHGVEERPGSAHGFGSIPNANEPKLIDISAWREDKGKLKQLCTGKTFKLKVARASNVTKQVSYQITKSTMIEETDTFDNMGPKKAFELLKGFVPLIKIKNAPNNISQKGNYTDFKMIRGIVDRHLIKGKTNMYFVSDDSVNLGEPNSAMTVFCSPELMKYGTYSELALVGTISESNDEKYGPSMNAVGILPIVDLPIEEDVSTIGEDSVDVDDVDGDGVVDDSNYVVDDEEIVDETDEFF